MDAVDDQEVYAEEEYLAWLGSQPWRSPLFPAITDPQAMGA